MENVALLVVGMKKSKTYLLKDLVTISAGYPFRGRIIEDLSSNIKVVQLKDVDIHQGINWDSCTASALTGKKAPNFLQMGDILYSTRGGHHAYYIDKGVMQGEFIASPHFFIIRSDSKELLLEFLTLVLNDCKSQRYVEKHAVGTLTKTLSKQSLLAMPITLPSIKIQQKLVDMACTMQKQRQLLENLIDNNAKLMSGMLSKTSNLQ